jgi:hypothetical protein
MDFKKIFDSCRSTRVALQPVSHRLKPTVLIGFFIFISFNRYHLVSGHTDILSV